MTLREQAIAAMRDTDATRSGMPHNGMGEILNALLSWLRDNRHALMNASLNRTEPPQPWIGAEEVEALADLLSGEGEQ